MPSRRRRTRIGLCGRRLAAMGAARPDHGNARKYPRSHQYPVPPGVLRRDHLGVPAGKVITTIRGTPLASAIAGLPRQRRASKMWCVMPRIHTWQTLASGFRPGRGQFIPDRFFRTRSAGRRRRTGAGGTGHGRWDCAASMPLRRTPRPRATAGRRRSRAAVAAVFVQYRDKIAPPPGAHARAVLLRWTPKFTLIQTTWR